MSTDETPTPAPTAPVTLLDALEAAMASQPPVSTPTGATWAQLAGNLARMPGHGIVLVNLTVTEGLVKLGGVLAKNIPVIGGAVKAALAALPADGRYVFMFAVYDWQPVAVLLPADDVPVWGLGRLTSGASSVPSIGPLDVIASFGPHGFMGTGRKGDPLGNGNGVAHMLAEAATVLPPPEQRYDIDSIEAVAGEG